MIEFGGIGLLKGTAMKSVVMKSIYAGLGMLGSGKESVEEIGKILAKKASLSEKDGERIARELRVRSERTIASLQKSLETEVAKVVKALHAATGGSTAKATKKKKPKAKAHAAKPRATKKKA
jgi:CRISPR/Cas system type I-B associated protein Csh2 (Cas7 group RAMP superfamily)